MWGQTGKGFMILGLHSLSPGFISFEQLPNLLSCTPRSGI